MFKYITILLLYSLLLFCFNIHGAIESFTNSNILNAAIILIHIGISIFTCSFLLINRFIFIVSTFVILLIGSLLTYFRIFFGITISDNLVRSCLVTNYEEISSVLSIKLIGFTILTFIIPFIFFYKTSNWLNIKIKQKILLSIAAISTSALLILSPIFLVKSIYPTKLIEVVAWKNYPINLFLTVSNICQNEYYEAKAEKIDVYKGYNFEFKEENVKVVLVIGESARADRFFTNYPRNLTPNLEKEENLAYFSNTSSLATITIDAVPKILKLKPNNHSNSLIKAFSKLGFATTWITDHKYNRILNNFGIEAAKLISRESIMQGMKMKNESSVKDGDLLPYLTKELDISAGNQFIVLHTMGSHRPYDVRYPEGFKKFSPVCTEELTEKSPVGVVLGRFTCDTDEKLINSYDNTILYTDYFLKKVIDALKPYKAMVIYVADHGESLGENGVYSHGTEYENAPKEQTHIPYFIWYSDKLLQQDPKMRKNFAVAKGNRRKYIDQSTVFHSILDCVNIKSRIIDKQRSICSESLKLASN